MSDCQKVKELLPLWIGQDLADATLSTMVERHLRECRNCELHRQNLQSSLDVLQSLSSGTLSSEGPHQSLWPKLSERISLASQPVPVARRNDRFSGWVPATVMMMAVAVMITVSLPSIRDEFFTADTRSSRSDLFNSPDPRLQMNVNQSIVNPAGESVGVPVKLDHKRKQEAE